VKANWIATAFADGCCKIAPVSSRHNGMREIIRQFMAVAALWRRWDEEGIGDAELDDGSGFLTGIDQMDTLAEGSVTLNVLIAGLCCLPHWAGNIHSDDSSLRGLGAA
jgi:hypothetical protein